MPATMPARLLPALLAVLIAAAPVSATGVPEFYLVDVAPGTDNSYAFDSSDAVELDGWAYFAATVPTHGNELWRAKGSSDGIDLELVKGAREGIGPDSTLLIDAGCVWDARTALKRVARSGWPAQKRARVMA